MAYNQISKIKYEKGLYILTINGNKYTLDEFYYEDLLAYVGKVLEVSDMLTLIAFSSYRYLLIVFLYKYDCFSIFNPQR